MARKGFAVTKDATVVGKPQKPTDMAVPPAEYVASVPAGIIVDGSNASRNSSQTVFIASGAALPKRAIDGKLVHVPYTELLNADGTPKPAKDIWAVLAKAGVPRYAELVTVSDDPGEAAANYYVLALMGYPGVKMLMP